MRHAYVKILLSCLMVTAPWAMASEEPRMITAQECKAATQYSNAQAGLALLVLVDGEPACETSVDAPNTAHELWSGTKSFVGMLAAAAVQDGLLTLDERVADTLPQWGDDELKQQVTLRQLLSMTSGQAGRIGRPEGYAASVEAGLDGPPGEHFQYGPAPMQTFGAVLTSKLRARNSTETPLEYLDRRVLRPAGISYAQWRSGPDGNPLLPQGAVLTARQWASFGELVRNKGIVDGRSLVDGEAFRAQFIGSAANAAYGLTWWLPRQSHSDDPITARFELARNPQVVPSDMVIAAGAGEQRLYVIPSLGMTIVRQAKLDLELAQRGASRWSDVIFLELLGIASSAAADVNPPREEEIERPGAAHSN